MGVEAAISRTCKKSAHLGKCHLAYQTNSMVSFTGSIEKAGCTVNGKFSVTI
jgi:hypothetical protein